jgi:hypothetical protein
MQVWGTISITFDIKKIKKYKCYIWGMDQEL